MDDQTLKALRAIAEALVELNATMSRMEAKVDLVSSVYQSLQKWLQRLKETLCT